MSNATLVSTVLGLTVPMQTAAYMMLSFRPSLALQHLRAIPHLKW